MSGPNLAMSRWLQVDVERLLYVHRGRDVILCDRQAEFIGPLGGTLLMRVSAEAERKLRDELFPAPFTGASP